MNYTIFGESHGPAIGVVLTGVPAGLELDMDAVAAEMARRAPGQDPTATARKEADQVEILSGVVEGKTCGTPLAAIIHNTDTRSKDYSKLKDLPRPSHGDYAGSVRYAGCNDYRGGGHFSGRLTAPLVCAGAVAKQILAPMGITVSSRVSMVGVCGLRLGWVAIVFKAYRSPMVLYLSYPVSWTLVLIVHVICFFFIRSHVRRTLAGLPPKRLFSRKVTVEPKR